MYAPLRLDVERCSRGVCAPFPPPLALPSPMPTPPAHHRNWRVVLIFFYEYIIYIYFSFYEYLFTSIYIYERAVGAALGLGEKTMAVSESVCLV